jgi:hypothetical protein
MSPKNLATSTARSATTPKRAGSVLEPPLAIFSEMFELLEDYAPLWYSEDLHNRAARALADLEKKKGFSLIRGRTSEKRMKRAAMETVTRPQSGICAVSAAARSSLSES